MTYSSSNGSFTPSLPLEFGDKNIPLPKPVSEYVSLSADHHKADEAGPLDGAIVFPDVRPLVLFTRPVQDLARFGAPGRDDLPRRILDFVRFLTASPCSAPRTR